MELLLVIIIIVLLFGYIIMLGVIVDYYSYKRRMIDKYMKESENDENEETNDNDRG